ncbi:AI-2E family transporter [Halomarina ordinaria]|uniref:AI-2E family transporter n=1 Tax=Halomarina ordinaria TaxID=3033939 RepID=A0ABD5UGZ9_9EURY|nr:AI-2E family transporter [Halomarina sp. PSRA2]
MRVEPEFVGDRSQVAWWALTLAVVAVFCYVVYSYLGAFVLGVFIYYATRPIYSRLGDRFPSRSLRAGLALLLIALPILLLIGYTVVLAARELGGLAAIDLSDYQTSLQPYLGDLAVSNPQELVTVLLENPQRLTDLATPSTVQDLLATAGGYAGLLASGLLQLFIALAVAFYLLRDDYKLAGWVRRGLADDDAALVAYGRAVDRDLKTVYFGNILNAFVVAVVAAISYNALNAVAPDPLSLSAVTFIALLAGAGSLVPVVGMKIVYIPVVVYLAGLAAITDPALLWYPLVFLLVSLAVIDGATEILLRPYISGRNLHVGLVLFAYILGPLVFGWYGLFLGPLVLVVGVHLARIVLPDLVHGVPVTPDAVGADPIPDLDGDEPLPSAVERVDDGSVASEGPREDPDGSGASGPDADERP